MMHHKFTSQNEIYCTHTSSHKQCIRACKKKIQASVILRIRPIRMCSRTKLVSKSTRAPGAHRIAVLFAGLGIRATCCPAARAVSSAVSAPSERGFP
jgi:hypothetical protein